MIRRASSAPRRLLGNTFVGDINRLYNKITINNTYVLVNNNNLNTYKNSINISSGDFKRLRYKGYYKLKLNGRKLDKRSIQKKWSGGKFIYSYRAPLPNFKHQDLLVLENKRKREIPKPRAAILEIVR